MSYVLRCSLLFLAGLLIYGQTFQFDFVFDDHFFIVDNPYIRHFSHIHLMWDTFPKTRLVGVYSFALNYFFDQLHPRGYHLFNLIVHFLAVGLVWALADLLFKITKFPENRLTKEFPFIIAFLFLVHPCQTEAVSYISQRFESMATVFYLGTMYCYLSARLSEDKIRKIVLFVLAGSLAIFGILTKEVAITVPLMMLAAEWILFPQKDHRILYWALALGGLLLYLLFSNLLHADLSILFRSIPSESHVGELLTPGKYFMTQLRVFLTFLRLLVLPVYQNLDYDYPASSGLLNPPLTLVGACAIVGIISLIVKLRRSFPLIAFGLAWTLITFSINLVPRNNVIWEHKLYLISFGYCLTVVVALYIWVRDQRALIGIFLSLIMILAFDSFQRNKVWQNDLTLCNDIIRKSPHKVRSYNNRGNAYGKLGESYKAISDYNKAIEMSPNYQEAYNNRGNTYFSLSKITQALSDFNMAIEIDPHYTDAYNNRGLLYSNQGNWPKAMADFNRAIDIAPNMHEGYGNRGNAFVKQGKYVQAISDFSKAIEIDPNNENDYNNRGNAYAKLGKSPQALSDFNKAIDIAPNMHEAYNNRGLIYSDRGYWNRAFSDYNKSLKIDPGYAEAYSNRGNAYEKQGNFIQALSDYNKAIEINPHLSMSYHNRGLVYAKHGNFNQAIFDFNMAIKIDPRMQEAYNDLGIIYYKLKEFDKAREYRRKAEELGNAVGPR